MALNNREILRIMTFSAYDLQLIRMQMGLRLTANFRNKLKRELEVAQAEEELDVGEEEDKNELSEKALKLIDELKASHRRLTDGVAKKSARTLPTRSGFTGDALISEFTELVLVDQYIQIERDERNQFSQLEEALIPLPIYQTFLKDQIGIGPAMAAVLVSYFDPHKAERISNFWSYAGLDVVNKEYFVANCNEIEASEEIDKLTINDPRRNLVIGEPVAAEDGKSLEELKAEGLVGIYEVIGRGRSRRAEHLIDRTYIKKDGSEGTRKSVTYNPWLKSRLLGALATSFLRTKNCPWHDQYTNYKQRITNDPNRLKVSSVIYKKAYRKIADGEEFKVGEEVFRDITKFWPPLRIHRAAMRFMIKMFLIEFWIAWRKVEGLKVTPTYHEAVLGHVHHRAAE